MMGYGNILSSNRLTVKFAINNIHYKIMYSYVFTEHKNYSANKVCYSHIYLLIKCERQTYNLINFIYE